MANEQIHVAAAFDNNYLRAFYALLTSVIQNNGDDTIYFHLIAPDVSAEIKEEIRNYARSFGSEVTYYSVDAQAIQNFTLSNKWTIAVYYRLFFPLVISKNINRLIYLDCDIVVISSLLPLYQIDFDNMPVAAVYDNYVKKQPLIGIHQEGQYFNSGVLLMNVPRWNDLQISEKTIEYLSNYPERILFVDQCALNAVLMNNWKKIDYKYNLLYSYLPSQASMSEIKLFVKSKSILHYTLHRPWNMLCQNRLRYLYYEYLQIYPRGNEFNRYTDFEITKIFQWLRIRLIEFYLDYPILQKTWKRIKASE
jgi:lipopolysaccharide biosynthesis glycosyltransferase